MTSCLGLPAAMPALQAACELAAALPKGHVKWAEAVQPVTRDLLTLRCGTLPLPAVIKQREGLPGDQQRIKYQGCAVLASHRPLPFSPARASAEQPGPTPAHPCPCFQPGPLCPGASRIPCKTAYGHATSSWQRWQSPHPVAGLSWKMS